MKNPELNIRIDGNTGCWEWTAAINAYGYGVFRMENKYHYAHRYFYSLKNGQIPQGRDLDHLCRNRKCCNPDHLEAVDRRTNLLRGETVTARNAGKTCCPRGHEYSPENTRVQKTKRGGDARFCRTCARERNKAMAEGRYEDWLLGNYVPVTKPRILREHKAAA